ncbi:hypothetical protein BU16DRAFT_526096 [Lophium mytilinum]|uniref:Uncharacterized protein n=1 Tax=Lophium mytilinum TaxID=390894 RepID=A0A6A6QZ61_9PEZI|nr:hypothetical protein BU16DRAFT_526096 [Lophium mytilinum]
MPLNEPYKGPEAERERERRLREEQVLCTRRAEQKKRLQDRVKASNDIRKGEQKPGVPLPEGYGAPEYNPTAQYWVSGPLAGAPEDLERQLVFCVETMGWILFKA